MGGLGSGRHCSYNAKATIADYHSIDIRKWQRKKLLIPDSVFTTNWVQDEKIIQSIKISVTKKFLTFDYRYHYSANDWRDLHYSIEIEWTQCKFGSKRPWFRCPASNCGRRAAILYGGALFACRRCHQLTYPSQRENRGHRATRKVEKIRKHLDWEPGILNGEDLKPKGMHWKTFKQLCFVHHKLVTLSLTKAISDLR